MNLANKLTMLRIVLIPIFMFFVLIRVPLWSVYSHRCFILAASTDGLDGYIARKRKQITNFGKLMDPLADKLLITAALIVLVELGLLAGWIAFIIIGREFLLLDCELLPPRKG